MRIDHHAYRKATRVAGFGFFIQLLFALVLLLCGLGAFGQGTTDTSLLFASVYAFSGLLIWLSLIVIFHQHTQERLEALEADEIAAQGAGSVFNRAEHEPVAARRLRLMHKWLMPIVSLALVAYLGVWAWMMIRTMTVFADPIAPISFQHTDAKGWALAICVGIALCSFILSRFVAGMAKLEAWQNLRGGAGAVVGNAVVTLAIAVGLGFRFFDNPAVIEGVAYAITIFMIVIGGEIVLNFILNLYRPRIPSEVPRPAFDSKLLSLLSAPDSIVRSINEAVNYQFGFDVTSSWGYQLLLRSVVWLLVFAVAVIFGLSTMVVLEPYEQAVKIRRGAIVDGHVYDSGIVWKLPWPLETVAREDVSRIRELPLTALRRESQRQDRYRLDLWKKDPRLQEELDPFIVGSSRALTVAQTTVAPGGSATEEDDVDEAISDTFAIVDAEIKLLYRIKPDGLLDYLRFTSEEHLRRQRHNERERALKLLALREITQYLSVLSLDDALGGGEVNVASALRDRIQQAFDRSAAGVEVVTVVLPLLRPSGQAGEFFQDYALAISQRGQRVAEAQQQLDRDLVLWIGNPDMTEQVLAAFEQYETLRKELGREAPQVQTLQQEFERLLAKAGGQLSMAIEAAEADRWIRLMNARADASDFVGRLDAYRAAPRLYQEREIMNVYRQVLALRRKYLVVGIDPDRVNLDVNLEEPPAAFDLSTQIGDGGQ